MQPLEGITATEATKILPTKNGKRVNRRTVLRWMRNGVRGIRLEGWQLGGVWMTTVAALDAFQRALTDRSIKSGAPASTLARDAATARAREILEREGLRRPRPQRERWQAKMAKLRARTNP